MAMAGFLDLFQNCVVLALKIRIIHTHLPADENQSPPFPSTISVTQSQQMSPKERNRGPSSEQNLPSLLSFYYLVPKPVQELRPHF
jgi:hypothetical protein